ncbi:MAG: sulfurtransferase TusA family protein [Syntrophaceae bacterium]|nr:sulfurtransferase TusA family protein [Syntrophaceae bacterium]
MSRIVDARGLSCPQPVIAALKEIKKPETGEIVVLVDTDTSKENVCRAAKSQGWQAKKIEPEGLGFKITLAKG